MIFIKTGFALCSDLPKVEKNTPKKSKIQLFNGKNLDGWYTFIKGRGRNNDPKKVFTVQNGLIRISGEEHGCITTIDEYDNYKLIFEFKWGEKTFAPREDKARDCGILLHSIGEDGAFSGTWMNSIECQIIEGGTGDLLIVGDGSEKFSMTCPVETDKQSGSYIFKQGNNPVTFKCTGRVNRFNHDPAWKSIKGFRGINEIEKPVGEWNRIELIVKGQEIVIYLNGILVNQAFDVKPSRGRIQIESEGAELSIKRIEMTLLL